MSNLVVFAILIVVNWWLLRTVSRYVARQRRASLMSTTEARAGHPTVPAGPIATHSAVSAPEPVARAFPVHGLPPSRDSAVALEGMLRRLVGVTAVYVSPVTALAYLDYLPALVTEEQLVQAIRRDGYRVGDESHRFDWRHVQQG
jgi:hypothetical protein